MNRRSALPVALVLLTAALPVRAQSVTAIVGGRIIDGLGGPPIENGVVLVEGGRIAAIGPAGSVEVPGGAEIVDASGGTVLPGLADMHVHLMGGWDGEAVDVLGYRRYLDALLYAGVTTVLDTGGLLLFLQQMRQEIEAGRIEGPRLRFVGPLLDGVDPVWPPISYRISSSAQAATVVDQLADGGVDALKAYGSLPDSLIAALVLSGDERGLPVLADVGPRNGSLPVVETGIRAFAHVGARPIADSTVAAMAERGVATITTLAVIESFAHRRFEDLSFLDDPLLARTMPPWFRDDLVAAATAEPSPEQAARARSAAAGLRNAMANVQALHEAGVLLVAGTDSPYPGVYYGEGLHRELELLVEAGLSPLEAISAATRNAAALLGEEDEWGSLTPGLAAELIVVDGRPDRNIGDARRIREVIRAGRRIDRTTLEFDPARHGEFRTSRPLRGPPTGGF